MTFKAGEKVKFKGTKGGDTVPNYTTNFVDVMHGSTMLNESYDKEFATVHSIIRIGEYAVEFIDDDGRKVRLCFKEESLEPVVIKNWRDRIKKK